MTLQENIRMALSSVLAHKLRSILTMLGIIIGVAAVITVVAIGQGGEQMLKSQLTGAGNTINVYYEPTDEEIQMNPNIYMESFFNEQDIEQLERLPDVKNVVASTMTSMTTRYREDTFDTTVYGINEAYLDVNELNVEKGRSLTRSDFASGARAGVISAELNKELFGKKSALGEVIWLNGQPIEVIGVAESPTGLFAFGTMDVYIPANTYRTSFGSLDYTSVDVQANDADSLQAVGEEATALLNDLHDTEDSYKVMNLEEMAEGVGQVTSIMTTIIGSIAGISLLVGGIGVMNIMLVSVTERTREIGIRKALGATQRQILTQFLIEALTLTLIGGIIGILLGAGASLAVSFFADWPSLISWQVVVGALLFSMAIGIIFGMLPANKAAKLDPIDSLRHE